MSYRKQGQPQPTERLTTTGGTVYQIAASKLNFADGKVAKDVKIRVTGDAAYYAFGATPSATLGYVTADGDELLLTAEEALALRIVDQTGSTALNLDITVYAK